MALSGTITGKCDNSNYTLTAEWSATQNTTANTSSVTVKVYITPPSGWNTNSSMWSCVINGTTVTSSKSANVTSKTLLGTRTFTVNHNSDGTASTTISFSYSNGLSGAGTYTTHTGSGSATITLNTIPRASSFTLNKTSGTLGSTSFTVTISKANSSFTHTVQYTIGSTTTTVTTKTTGTTASFTPPLSLANQITTATSGTATVKVITYNGTTQTGSTTKTITLSVPTSVVPSTGISVTASNQTAGLNIANKTTFTVKTSNAAGSYGSTIKSYAITAGSYNSSTSSLTTGTFTGGTYTFTVKVTDSRGRTATATQSVTIYAYSAPTASVNAYRCTSNGTKSSTGAYVAVNVSWNITNLGNTNTNEKQYSVQYKTTTSTSYTTSINYTNLTNYTGSSTIVLPNTFSTTSSYDINFLVKDSFTTTSALAKVSTASALFNIEQNGVGVGKIHERGALDVSGKIYTDDRFVCSGNGKEIYIGTGESDVFILNNSSEKYLQLKDTGDISYTGNWLLAYNTSLYGAISNNTSNTCIAKIASHGGVDLGDTTQETAILSKSQPTWWNGSKSRKLACSINPENIYVGDAGSDAAVGFIARRYLNSTQLSAKLMVINEDNGCAALISRNENEAFEINVYLKALTSSTGYFRPSVNNGVSNGTSSYKWTAVYANNGTIQTSDARHKAIIDDTNLQDCFDMVKNTPVYNYVMLNGDKTEMNQFELVEQTLMNVGKPENIQVGILAQDILQYECSEYVLVHNENEDGTDEYSINNYNLTSAIMGALKVEIEKREELEIKVNNLEEENAQLKQRLEAIEKALGIGGENNGETN